MAVYSKINNIDSAAVSKINGVQESSIAKVSGYSKPSSGPAVASRWLIGSTSGRLYSTTVSDASSGWSQLVDLGTNTFKDVAVGLDNSGNKRWVIQASNNTNEIYYANNSLDLSDSNNWTSVDFSPNYKAVDYGPGVAWGNNVWIAGGIAIADADSYITLNRSTDGADSWSPIDEGNTVNDSSMAVCYKLESTWFFGHRAHIWKSIDNGATWSDLGALVGGNKDVRSMAYDGTGRWVAVVNSDLIFYSDDDWASNTEASNGAWTGTWHPNGVIYAKGNINKWVVCGNNGRLAYSSDGASWSTIWDGLDPDWGTTHIRAIATDDTTIVIVGDSGKIAYSTTGTNFTIVTTGLSTSFKTITSDIIGAGLR